MSSTTTITSTTSAATTTTTNTQLKENSNVINEWCACAGVSSIDNVHTQNTVGQPGADVFCVQTAVEAAVTSQPSKSAVEGNKLTTC